MHEWFSVSELTGRIEVGCCRRSKEEAQAEKWQLREVSQLDKKKRQAELPNKDDKGKDKDKDNAVTTTPLKKQKGTGEVIIPDESSWKNLYHLKKVVDGALASAYSLKRRAETDSSWQWVCSVPEHKVLVDKLAEYEMLQCQHRFWNDVHIVGAMSELRKCYDDARMHREYAANAAAFAKLAADLSAATGTISKIVAARGRA